MKSLTHAEAYQVLLLQAADEGRGPILFGESLSRAKEALLPFMIGEEFPSVYIEHPLTGSPFLDVTVLYSSLLPGSRIASDMVAGMDDLIDWCAEACNQHPNTCFGFEVDTKDPRLPAAALHFQPRTHVELVEPFCELAGEPGNAQLYLDLAARMPEGWALSFFGMFRGRPGSPLRVCGYLHKEELDACTESPAYLAGVFDKVGFTAYDDAMLEQVCALFAAAPEGCDFQFDVYPDGNLGNIFAIDVKFGIEQPAAVRASFADGPVARVMGMLEDWGAADGRWKLAGDAAFARSLPIQNEDGSKGKYSFVLMPQWLKARWADGVLQPAKLYHFMQAGVL